MSDNDFIITINDVRATGHCVRGIKRWFEMNRLDFADFLANGIPAEKVINVDAIGISVVEKVKAARNG